MVFGAALRRSLDAAATHLLLSPTVQVADCRRVALAAIINTSTHAAVRRNRQRTAVRLRRYRQSPWAQAGTALSFSVGRTSSKACERYRVCPARQESGRLQQCQSSRDASSDSHDPCPGEASVFQGTLSSGRGSRRLHKNKRRCQRSREATLADRSSTNEAFGGQGYTSTSSPMPILRCQ